MGTTYWERPRPKNKEAKKDKAPLKKKAGVNAVEVEGEATRDLRLTRWRWNISH